MNNAISMTPPLADTPIILNGEIRTTTFGPELDDHLPRTSEPAAPAGTSAPCHHPPEVVLNKTASRRSGCETLPAEVAGSLRHSENDHIKPDDSRADLGASRNRQTLPAAQQSISAVLTVSSDSQSASLQDASSSDVEVVDVVSRRRPPTRLSPQYNPRAPGPSHRGVPVEDVQTPGPTHHQVPGATQHRDPVVEVQEPGPLQYGVPIVEVHVDVRQWHICRTTYRGAGPACFAATPGRRAPRALCKTKLRVSGFPRQGVGIVSPSFIGKSVYMSVERDYRFWFCPNGKCHRDPGAPQCKNQMPHVPSVFPMQIGTGLTQEEVDFLTDNGFVLVRRTVVHAPDTFPSKAEIKVILDGHTEKVQDFPRNHRFKSRRGRGCRQKLQPSNTCNTRLERARSEQMQVLYSWLVTTGNGWGKVFKIASGQEPTRVYIVQICCIPSCSCQDFFDRETRGATFSPCKHIYWVYLNVLHLDPNTCKRIHQPVHTMEEVEAMLTNMN
ncbi:hypothetical protein R1sor_004945 [Riccia sorocarpa]|uniref:SWIM-type domain-containing protein n=1 Tax=Riccia sorocarpa TaxID=122646 RepID=A0ABD3HPL4_9MARC